MLLTRFSTRNPITSLLPFSLLSTPPHPSPPIPLLSFLLSRRFSLLSSSSTISTKQNPVLHQPRSLRSSCKLPLSHYAKYQHHRHYSPASTPSSSSSSSSMSSASESTETHTNDCSLSSTTDASGPDAYIRKHALAPTDEIALPRNLDEPIHVVRLVKLTLFKEPRVVIKAEEKSVSALVWMLEILKESKLATVQTVRTALEDQETVPERHETRSPTKKTKNKKKALPMLKMMAVIERSDTFFESFSEEEYLQESLMAAAVVIPGVVGGHDRRIIAVGDQLMFGPFANDAVEFLTAAEKRLREHESIKITATHYATAAMLRVVEVLKHAGLVQVKSMSSALVGGRQRKIETWKYRVLPLLQVVAEVTRTEKFLELVEREELKAENLVKVDVENTLRVDDAPDEKTLLLPSVISVMLPFLAGAKWKLQSSDEIVVAGEGTSVHVVMWIAKMLERHGLVCGERVSLSFVEVEEGKGSGLPILRMKVVLKRSGNCVEQLLKEESEPSKRAVESNTA